MEASAFDSKVDAVGEADESVIHIRGLHKGFGSLVVLNAFDLDLFRGETVVVLGKSGSGKSVLIKWLDNILVELKTFLID